MIKPEFYGFKKKNKNNPADSSFRPFMSIAETVETFATGEPHESL